MSQSCWKSETMRSSIGALLSVRIVNPERRWMTRVLAPEQTLSELRAQPACRAALGAGGPEAVLAACLCVVPARALCAGGCNQAWGGMTETGQEVLLGIGPATKQEMDSCRDLLRDLEARGLVDPVLGLTDGAPSLIRAFKEVSPRSLRQRCLAHKMRDLDSNVPAEVWREVKGAALVAYQAGSPKLAPVCRAAAQAGNWPRRGSLPATRVSARAASVRPAGRSRVPCGPAVVRGRPSLVPGREAPGSEPLPDVRGAGGDGGGDRAVCSLSRQSFVSYA